MIRVLSVFGTRPEAVKMAPVIRALEARPGEFRSVVAVTAQHREMLDQVLSAFRLRVDFDLDVMTPGQSPEKTVVRVLERLPSVLSEVAPTILLVQGDTMTTFAAALAAHLQKVQTGHVEAGLRTWNRYSPFPEEMNRVLTTRLASVHFAPTPGARDNLLAEGVPAANVHLTGNTVIDALLQTVQPGYRFRHPELQGLDGAKRLILITTHRRESFGEPLRNTCAAIRELAARFPDLEFVLPVHPNPEVKRTVETQLRGLAGMHLIDPVDYVEFVHLLSRAHLVLTDSGGIQEEAPSLGKPVLVLREITERPEGVQAGTAVVVGTDKDRIVALTSALLTDRESYARMANATNPYGDGRAAQRIVDALAARFAPRARTSA